MILSNLIFRIRQYAYENRARLIRAILIAAGALLFALLIYYGAEYVASARSARKIAALEALERDASARAKSLEAEADLLKTALLAKYDQVRDLEARAANAEAALRKARLAVEPLKETYEKARDNPGIPADTTCADACTELARLGWPCK